MAVTNFKLHVAAIPFHWSAEQVMAFHTRLQDYPISSVSLGESVCSKRRLLNDEDWLTIAELHRQKGRKIGLASLPMYVAQSEQKAFISLLTKLQPDFVEAQDYAAIAMAEEHGTDIHGCGSLNLYHADAIHRLNKAKLTVWQPSVEMPAEQIKMVMSQLEGIECELSVWGYQPLAISARCFSARHHKLAKDACKQICQQDPAGKTVKSREHEQLFTINGVQTLSHTQVNLLPHLQEINEMGCRRLRLVPDQQSFFDALDYLRDSGELSESLRCSGNDGYWQGKTGFDASTTIPVKTL